MNASSSASAMRASFKAARSSVSGAASPAAPAARAVPAAAASPGLAAAAAAAAGAPLPAAPAPFAADFAPGLAAVRLPEPAPAASDAPAPDAVAAGLAAVPAAVAAAAVGDFDAPLRPRVPTAPWAAPRVPGAAVPFLSASLEAGLGAAPMPSMPLMASLAAAVDAGPDEEVAGPAAGAASRAAGEGSAAGLRASVTVRRSAATRAVSSGALWLQKPNTRAPGKPSLGKWRIAKLSLRSTLTSAVRSSMKFVVLNRFMSTMRYVGVELRRTTNRGPS
mmetsp:Transcript_8562/g.33854  ORF Transcript_8562/g.33854 Transcript_8562/m.33854 type:complete len:277 (+) Transcript_8562:512-1342(+)